MSWLDIKWFLEDAYDSVSDAVSDGIGAVTDFIDENPKTSIAIGVIAGIATAGVAAPAIAATIGATGALGATAGGTGMAGGTCVVAAGGGVLAGGISAGGVVTTKKLKS